MKHSLLLALGVVLLSGCSRNNDFTPEAGMDGETIFKATCAECHQADAEGYYFELEAGTNIADRVRNGGMMMPAFPNIHGDALASLEDYVTAHSRMAE